MEYFLNKARLAVRWGRTWDGQTFAYISLLMLVGYFSLGLIWALALSAAVALIGRQTQLELFKVKKELQGARDSAQRDLAARSSSLNNISHEMRTPLNSILGFVEVLGETDLDHEQKEYLRTIERCSKTLLHLINNILDYAKIESGHLATDNHVFDLRELHTDIHKIFALSCAEKGLDLQLAVDPEVPHYAVGDSYRIKQILMNLVGNAVKFTEKGIVRIEVKVSTNGSGLTWVVLDTGKGVRTENIESLFLSYFQEDPSVARNFGGTGLGLTICKSLVDMMGGQISVHSKPGEGTIFTFSLPLQLSRSPGAKDSSSDLTG